MPLQEPPYTLTYQREKRERQIRLKTGIGKGQLTSTHTVPQSPEKNTEGQEPVTLQSQSIMLSGVLEKKKSQSSFPSDAF